MDKLSWSPSEKRPGDSRPLFGDRRGSVPRSARLDRSDLYGSARCEGSGKFLTRLVRDAVSKPNFAGKYAFESSRRDLHSALLRTSLQS